MADPTILIDFLCEQLSYVKDRSWYRVPKDGEAHLQLIEVHYANASHRYAKEEYSEAFEELKGVLRCTIEAMDSLLKEVTPLKHCKHCGQPFSDCLLCMCIDETGHAVPGEAEE